MSNGININHTCERCVLASEAQAHVTRAYSHLDLGLLFYLIGFAH